MSTEDAAGEIDMDELADRVANHMEPGAYGDKMVLTRRQLLAVAGGSLSAGALATWGVGDAEAQQAVGQVGTDADRVDVYGNNVVTNSVEADNLSLTPADQRTVTFASGETQDNASTTFSLSQQPLLVTVDPANDPGNDHGYSLDGKWYDNSANAIRIRVTETEAAGGGDAEITVWELST